MYTYDELQAAMDLLDSKEGEYRYLADVLEYIDVMRGWIREEMDGVIVGYTDDDMPIIRGGGK